MKKPTIGQRFVAFWERSTHPGVIAVACIASLIFPGLIAVRMTNPDQGHMYTLEELPRLKEEQVLLIQNSTTMPPQAKAMALGVLQRGGGGGRPRN